MLAAKVWLVWLKNIFTQFTHHCYSKIETLQFVYSCERKLLYPMSHNIQRENIQKESGQSVKLQLTYTSRCGNAVMLRVKLHVLQRYENSDSRKAWSLNSINCNVSQRIFTQFNKNFVQVEIFITSYTYGKSVNCMVCLVCIFLP